MRECALDALARREHSRFELQRKLVTKGYDSSSVEKELNRLNQDGLLSDSRFAEAYVHYRSRRGFGPNRVCGELRERGVDETIIECTLEALDLDWSSILDRTWRKKFGRPPKDFQEKAKHHRFLEYRGFRRENIAQYLSQLQENAPIES